MKPTKFITLFSLLGGSIALLSGCNIAQKIESLKEGLQVLNTKKNYSFNITQNKRGYVTEYPALKFTEKYIGFENDDVANTDMLIKDKDGIYRLSYGDDNYLRGEYLLNEKGERLTDLWDKSAVFTMLNVSTDYVNGLNAKLTELEITDKDYKLGFIQTIGYSIYDYSYIKQLTASFEEKVLTFDLIMEVDTTKFEYIIKVDSIGNTVSKKAKSLARKSNGAYTVNGELAEFRRLMKSNNFIQLVYDFDYEGYMMRYHFCEHYLYNYYINYQPDGSIAPPTSVVGAMELVHTDDPADPTDTDLYGVYSFGVTDGVPGFLNMPSYSEPDITKYYHYPMYMQMWSSMEYIKEGDIRFAKYEFDGSKHYYIDDDDLIEDFKKNFSIDQSSFGDLPSKGLGIELDLNQNNPSESWIVFHYLLKYGADTYDYKIPFYGFGKANDKGLDELLKLYNDNID